MFKILRNHFITIPLPPLLVHTLLYMFGIIAGSLQPAFLWLLAGVFIIAPLSCFLARSWKQFFLCCSFLIGVYRYSTLHTDYRKQSDILAQAPINIQATIIESEVTPKKTVKQSLLLKSNTLYQRGNRVALYPIIRLYLFKSTRLIVGDEIKIRNLTVKVQKNASYCLYLEKEGIAAALFIPHVRYHLIKRPYMSFARWRSRRQDRLINQLRSSLSHSTFALMSTLFFGKKPDNEEMYLSIRKQCSAWGIVHYLARSGLHVVLILFGLGLLLRRVAIHYLAKQCILLFFIILYHLFTWPSISFMRALITFILYTLCTFQMRSFQTLHILTLTTLIILLANPLQLFFLDFQLSFGLTFALAWFNEVKIKIKRLDI